MNANSPELPPEASEDLKRFHGEWRQELTAKGDREMIAIFDEWERQLNLAIGESYDPQNP